jgi:signal peptidase II
MSEQTETGGRIQSGGLQGLAAVSLWLGLALAIVGLDQVTKLAIIRWVELYDRIPITSFFNITHHQNTGAAFSFLADAGGWQRWFFTALAAVVSLVIAAWLYRIRDERQYLLASGLAFVLGGAIGNLIDRVRLGYVTDFIQVIIVEWPFPSFNIADAAITVGAAFLIIDSLFVSGRAASEP